MSKYLRKFETEAEYSAATIYRPSVSLILDNMDVKFDPIQPTPPALKYKLTLSDSSVVSAACDGTSAITQADTSAYTSTTVAAEIGNCVSKINDRTFQNFSRLSSVSIPSSVTSIGYRGFYSCTSLQNLDIPSSVISIGQNAFHNVPWWRSYSADTSHHYGNIVYINDVAYDTVNTSITSVTFKYGTKGIGGGAFYNCTGLTTITIPNSVIHIDGSAFDNCTSLQSISIPSGVTSIEGSVFSYCTSLQSIDIPDSVTSIGFVSFQYCSGLTSCTIGSGVTSIGQLAFQNCTNLQSITVNATTPPSLGSYPFNNTNNCPIYVPAASVETYKSASGWSTYADRIQAIPTPSYKWVSYASGDTVPTATTVYGVKLYENYDEGYNVIFSGTTGDYIKFHPNGNFGEWAAEDENGTPIDISSYISYQAGRLMYTIVFSDLGLGGMNIISPTTIFEDDINLYVTN